MQIKAIEQITSKEQEELDKLKADSKQRRLTSDEDVRKLFLEMKQVWNCEC